MHTLDADVKPKLSAMRGCLSSSAIVELEWSSHSFSQPVTVFWSTDTLPFLLRDADMHSTYMLRRRGWLDVTRRYCIKTAKP